MIAPVPVHCFSITFFGIKMIKMEKIQYFAIKSYVVGVY